MANRSRRGPQPKRARNARRNRPPRCNCHSRRRHSKHRGNSSRPMTQARKTRNLRARMGGCRRRTPTRAWRMNSDSRGKRGRRYRANCPPLSTLSPTKCKLHGALIFLRQSKKSFLQHQQQVKGDISNQKSEFMDKVDHAKEAEEYKKIQDLLEPIKYVCTISLTS